VQLNKLFGHHNGMKDVLQGCGDACGSFCTALHIIFCFGKAEAKNNMQCKTLAGLPSCPRQMRVGFPSNDAPDSKAACVIIKTVAFYSSKDASRRPEASGQS